MIKCNQAIWRHFVTDYYPIFFYLMSISCHCVDSLNSFMLNFTPLFSFHLRTNISNNPFYYQYQSICVQTWDHSPPPPPKKNWWININNLFLLKWVYTLLFFLHTWLNDFFRFTSPSRLSKYEFPEIGFDPEPLYRLIDDNR